MCADTATVSVHDGVLTQESLRALRGLVRTRSAKIFDRRRRHNDTLETLVDALLRQLGDRSAFAEYWTRHEWGNLGLHRDLDEGLVRKNCGRQRSPHHAHVLYVSVALGLAAPTCVFSEEGADMNRTGGVPHRLDGVYCVRAPGWTWWQL